MHSTSPASHLAKLPAAEARCPRLIHDPQSLRDTVLAAQRADQSVGLVPTMGALHEGHLSLVDAARAECDLALVSIFVNPTQFAPDEDFASYPRNLERDLTLLAERGCDIVFAPSQDNVYRPQHATVVDVGPIGHVLEGEFRPTHFQGVATVVLKLFNMAPADRAYFGRKDYQQTLVVRQLVADLNVPMEIRICPIVREQDGLAMSSRNAYLTADERKRARAIYQSLQLAEKMVAAGERDVTTIRHQMRKALDLTGGIELQYIAFVADGTVNPVEIIIEPTTIALAAVVGNTRLIDNTLLKI